jgi:hypothetical protein
LIKKSRREELSGEDAEELEQLEDLPALLKSEVDGAQVRETDAMNFAL